MSTAYVAKLVGNRRWSEDANGCITSLTRRYQIIRSGPILGSVAEEIIASQVTGLPQKGSVHSDGQKGLVCSSYSWEEGTGSAKNVLYCDVHYANASAEGGDANNAPPGQAVEAFGWRSGSVSRDIVKNAADGKLVVNTAGQPFDTVPQIDVPSPTFQKVMKTKQRQSWIGFCGKVNNKAITIGSVSCGKHCLKCVQVDEERLWSDAYGFMYRYTIGLQLMTNVVAINGANAADIGWDLAIVSCGTMEKKEAEADATPIKTVSSETGQEVFVSSPVLLDVNGKAQLTKDAVPYLIKVQPYEDAAFPDDFTSEPDVEEDEEEESAT